MKKAFYVLAVMFAIVMMAGCDSLNPSERLNVGKWYTVYNHVSDSVGGTDYSGEQYDEYNEDKACSSKATIRYVVYVENGIQEIVTLSITTKGTWSITDKTFNENTTDVDIQIVDLSFEGENLTDDKSVIQKFIASEKKRLYYELVIPLKKDYMGEDSCKIITLNETTCVTVDKDGTRTESRKIQ
mgnify:CR=1 FL=1